MAGGLGALLVSWCLLSFVPWLHDWLGGDVDFYENWGAWVAGHRLPYRDFAFEYPPGALPLFTLPVYLRKLAGYHGDYRFWFRVELLVVAALVLVCVAVALARLGASRRRAWAALLLVGLGPLLVGPIALSRYDYLPALVAAAAVAALLSGRGVLSCALVAAGMAIKVWPGVLAPFALFELWRRRGPRGVVEGLGAGVLVLAAGFAPYAALGGHGLDWALVRQSERPLQVESLGGGFVLAAEKLGDGLGRVVNSHGSDNVVGAWPDHVATLSTIATVLAILGIYALYLRGRPSAERLVAACAAAVTAYVAFTKVFSPQYLVWLVPLVPLLGRRSGARASALFVAILLLTQVWEPYRYHQLVTQVPGWLVALVVVRNLLVLVLLGLLVAPLLASERHAEQLDPARASAV
ncbi:MAG TPA: glycosyltransferase 87 family protein [Gaiellaceae bacterium]|nr:glycosyltransferase 87 family protein [Gaiellaceae bacterium]